MMNEMKSVGRVFRYSKVSQLKMFRRPDLKPHGDIQRSAIRCLVLVAAFILLPDIRFAYAAATVTTLPNINVSVDSVSGPSIHLGNIVLTEGAKADIKNGTIILHAPAGFNFDPTASVTVSVVNAGGATLAISGSPATPTTNSVTITTSGSGGGGGGARSTVTWAGIKVRSTGGNLPWAGTITKTGTAAIVGNPANFGTMTRTAGTVAQLAIANGPIVVTAGMPSALITAQRQDKFGNPVSAEAARTVILSSDSSGTVTFNPASPIITNGSSIVRFTYKDTKHGIHTITASSTSPTTVTSDTYQITVSPPATSTWIGDGPDDAWSTSANWTNDLDPGIGTVVHFAGLTRLSPSNDLTAGTTFHSIYFDGTAGEFNLIGNQATVPWVIENNSSNAQHIAMPIILPEGNNVALRTILGSGDLTISGEISGLGGLVKQVLADQVTKAILSGSNTYSGQTEIVAGLLSISSI